jgi:RNA polymerase sigma-70 factor (ECF subfamily)
LVHFPDTSVRSPAIAADDAAVLAALRRGDEAAFAALIDRYHGALVRVAMLYVGERGAAEDVAQETWLGVVQGIDGFEGRSSLKTWIFRILLNRA